jgi:hypothetical protein
MSIILMRWAALFSLFCLAAVAQKVAPLKPADVLRQVYESSQDQPPIEHSAILMDLIRVSMATDRPVAIRYAREMFEESFTIPVDVQSRRSNQGIAFQFLLTAGDTKGAMAAFGRMEAPPKELAGQPMQDFRDYAVSRLLPVVIKDDRKGGLLWAVQAIMDLGQTAATYPFASVTVVIEELLKDDPPMAETLYAQATEGFRKGEKIGVAGFSGRQFFVTFVLKFNGKIKPALEKEAVLLAVDAVQEAKPLPNFRSVVRLKMKNDSTAELGSLDELSLYKLLPLLARYDAERATRIKEGRESFANVLEDGGAIVDAQTSNVIGRSDDTVSRFDSIARRELDWDAGQKASQMATKDLTQATDLAGGIENIGARAGALASIAAAIASDQPDKGRAMVDEALSLAEKVKEPDQHLRVLVRALVAQDRLHDLPKVAAIYSELLKQGMEVIAKESKLRPEFLVTGQKGYAWLVEATQVMAKRNLEMVVAQLAHVDSVPLAAHLKIEAAGAALAEPRPQP